MSVLALLLVLGSSSAGATPQDQPAIPRGLPLEKTAGWAVLADGRIKPLDTVARESITAVTGRHSIDGLDPLEFFWGFHFAADSFADREYVKVNGQDLKAHIGLDPAQRRFAFSALLANTGFRDLVEEARQQQSRGEDLTPLQREALKAYSRLERAAALMEGHLLAVVPRATRDGGWTLPDELASAEEPALKDIYQGFSGLAAAWGAGDAAAFGATADRLTGLLRSVDPGRYPEPAQLERELGYNRLNAFGKAWGFYLAAFLLLALLGRSRRRLGYALGLAALIAGLGLHTWGIALRWQIAGRAPVSDMYESLVFMGWGIITIGTVLEFFYRRSYFGMAAGLMGFIALAFAENLPIDSAINPLVPVLANTSWLAIHVMTVMMAYSAFALALGIGHIVLAVQLFRPGKTTQLRSLSTLLYKTLQVGVLFLAAGIAFGAIWANESWGRYWGWDPKETWSLITFFVYMVLVHARFAGWLSHFGLALGSILSFQAVIMTYYGVNFILGTGLHSYGFSSGGVLFVTLYVALELGIILGALLRYRAATRKGIIPRPVPA